MLSRQNEELLEQDWPGVIASEKSGLGQIQNFFGKFTISMLGQLLCPDV